MADLRIIIQHCRASLVHRLVDDANTISGGVTMDTRIQVCSQDSIVHNVQVGRQTVKTFVIVPCLKVRGEMGNP